MGGYRCRVADIRTAQAEDLDGIFDLLSTRSRAAFGISEILRDHVAHALTLPNGTDRWVALDAAEIVGYAALDSSQDLVHAAVDPEVGDALLARAVARGAERGFTHVSVTTVPEDRPLSALVDRHGFVHDRDILRMWRRLDEKLDDVRLPDGVSVRSYDDADGERVHALLDASYSAWDTSFVALPHDEWLAFMTRHEEFDPELWFVVERAGELIACALFWKEQQGSGWVKDIAVAPSERGHGLGRALLRHAFAAYAERGAERVGLKVDSCNPSGALQLYARTGFVTDRRYGIWTHEL
jgi:ribosomal protein S18 acetylase RimI-like enzyme